MGGFTYAIPVAGAGCYSVTLHFAEIYFGVAGGGGDGSRVFNVSIEGTSVLSSYDIHAAVGPAAATTETFQLQVADSVIDIAFTKQVNNAKISGIEITPNGSTCGTDDPIAGLALSSNSPNTLGSPTDFNASVTGGTNVTYDWNFGDGTTVADGGLTQTHTYGTAGSYTASVTASNGASTETENVTVTVTAGGDDPIAGLTLNTAAPTGLGSPTALTASVTGGTNVTYDWNFGDGTTVDDGGPSVNHTYGSLGSYTATVTATNAVSNDSATATVVVQDESVSGVTVTSGGPVEINTPASLTASVATGTNVSYDWNFGDGTIVSDAGPSVTHLTSPPALTP